MCTETHVLRRTAHQSKDCLGIRSMTGNVLASGDLCPASNRSVSRTAELGNEGSWFVSIAQLDIWRQERHPQPWPCGQASFFTPLSLTDPCFSTSSHHFSDLLFLSWSLRSVSLSFLVPLCQRLLSFPDVSLSCLLMLPASRFGGWLPNFVSGMQRWRSVTQRGWFHEARHVLIYV